MTERLTWKEIKEKYPSQWIGLEDVKYACDSRSISSAGIRHVGLSWDAMVNLKATTEHDLILMYTSIGDRIDGSEVRHTNVDGSPMTVRMSWDKIKELYPDQWIGMTDVKYETWDDGVVDDINIESAIVSYIGFSRNELEAMQLCMNIGVDVRYTTPNDDKLFVG